MYPEGQNMMMAGGRRGESLGLMARVILIFFSKTTPEQIYSNFTRGEFTRTCTLTMGLFT